MTYIIIICAVALLLALSLYLAAKEQTKGRGEGALKTLDIMEADFEPVAEPEPARPARTFRLAYTGPAQPPSWNNYDTPKMTGRETKNVGRYTATFEGVYITPGLERAMRRYAEQLRRVKKWEHYAAHAKKARTRKKYRNRLREYYSREPAFRPAGLYSGHGINSTSGVQWLRTPGPGVAAYSVPPSKMGGFSL